MRLKWRSFPRFCCNSNAEFDDNEDDDVAVDDLLGNPIPGGGTVVPRLGCNGRAQAFVFAGAGAVVFPPLLLLLLLVVVFKALVVSALLALLR